MEEIEIIKDDDICYWDGDYRKPDYELYVKKINEIVVRINEISKFVEAIFEE